MGQWGPGRSEVGEGLCLDGDGEARRDLRVDRRGEERRNGRCGSQGRDEERLRRLGVAYVQPPTWPGSPEVD